MSGAALDLTEEQDLEFKEAFLFDKDGNGKITIKVISQKFINDRYV